MNRVINFLFNFIYFLILKPHPQSTTNLSDSHYNLKSVYRSLNRAILYQLSRPILTRTDQWDIIDLLKYLIKSKVPIEQPDLNESFVDSSNFIHPTSSKYFPIDNTELLDDSNPLLLLFSDLNADPEFPPCLVHLLMLFVRMDPEQDSFDSIEIEQKSIDEDLGKSNCPVQSYYHTTFDFDELGTLDMHGNNELMGNDEVSNQLDKQIVQTMIGEDEKLTKRGLLTKHIKQLADQLWSNCYLSRKMVRNCLEN